MSSLAPASAFAQDLFWDGSSFSNWNDDFRWSPGGTEPTAANNAHINSGLAVVNLPGEVAANLYVGGNPAPILFIQSGGQLSSNFGILGANAATGGVVTVSGDGSTWNNTSSLFVGQNGNGTLQVTSGADVTNNFATIGFAPGSISSVQVADAGSTWTSTGDLAVGEGGSGTLQVTDGGEVTNNNASIGKLVNSLGTAEVTGAGSVWTSTGNLTVGDQGSGSLTNSNGGSVHVGDSAQAGATAGWLTISDSTNTDGTGFGGHLYIQNGSYLDQDGSVLLGDEPGEFGYATVSGAGSTLNITSDLFVGLNGTGSLTTGNGGTVNVGDAAQAGAKAGWLTISDSTNSSGKLRVNNGSTLNHSGDAVLGTAVATIGSAAVRGTNSTWNNAGELHVGYDGGIGFLTVADGGEVSNTFGRIGHSNPNDGIVTTSTGYVDVVGEGST